MHPFSCGQCGTTVYFENSQCGVCGATLGFVPEQRRMAAFAQAEADNTLWQAQGAQQGQAWLPCANRLQHAVCNWMVAPDDHCSLCRSCRLTSHIPALAEPGNLERWRLFEQAKRRLVFSLIMLGLAPRPKTAPDDMQGLAFALQASLPGQPPVLTGHDDGVITINAAECDDVQREAARVAFGEPARSLLGHLRHETAHWLQQAYIDNTPAIDTCRAVFGDERVDYSAALAQHYQNGPPVGWALQHVSAYASAHPWEDWAETCAHYLLIVDAVQTAAAWGLQLNGPAAAAPQLVDAADVAPVDDLVLQQWLPVALFLNSMNRSLGQRDAYPYQMPDAVLHKLGTVQALLKAAAAGVPAQTTPALQQAA